MEKRKNSEKKKYLQKSLGVLFLTELTLAHQEGLVKFSAFFPSKISSITEI